jgi:hypothetical protein
MLILTDDARRRIGGFIVGGVLVLNTRPATFSKEAREMSEKARMNPSAVA